VSLTVVGTGYNVAGQVTPEAEAAIRRAERCFYLVSEPATSAWIRSIQPRARSLHDCYRAGEPGLDAWDRMVDRILAEARQGKDTCAAFYGHPAIYVPPGLASVRQARREGIPARLLPGISFEDCLIADLGVDPAVAGRLMFEATDFLIRARVFDATASLVLLQVGAIGLTDFTPGDRPNHVGLAVLAEVLRRHYPTSHRVALYRIAQLPIFDPRIDWVPLSELADAPLSVTSTLYVPALPKRPLRGDVLARLQRLAEADG
jgi:uncharacterized protein YabN with tetrapyrrole methylase and pyrophosphatase domain